MSLTRHARSLVAAAGALAFLGGASLATTPQAHAHDVVLESTPGDGATVESFPRTVEMKFSGIPKPQFNRVAVSDSATQEVLYSTEPALDGQQLSFAIPDQIDPGPGQYVIGYQITSSDGHATRGKLTFTVAETAASQQRATQSPDSISMSVTPSAEEPGEERNNPASSAAGAEEKTESTSLPIALGGGLVLVLAMVALVAFIAHKNRK